MMNVGKAMARRLAAARSVRGSSSSMSSITMRPRRSLRIAACPGSMMPSHSNLASARLVSKLSGRYEDRRACSTSRHFEGKADGSDIETSGEDSYSDSESLWSSGEEILSETEGLEDEEGDDSSVNEDKSFWDRDAEPEREDFVGSPKAESALVNEPVCLETDADGHYDGGVSRIEQERYRQHELGVEARSRREAEAYLKTIRKEYEARSWFQDDHCKAVHSKLAHLKPDPDGRYRNLIDVVSDTDILLEAYRRVKAGSNRDPSTIRLDNVKMDWFYETQAKLRTGKFELQPVRVAKIGKQRVEKLRPRR